MRTGIICLLLSALVAVSLAIPYHESDDDLALVVGDLASQIIHLVRPVNTIGTQKRNSELIKLADRLAELDRSWSVRRLPDDTTCSLTQNATEVGLPVAPSRSISPFCLTMETFGTAAVFVFPLHRPRLCFRGTVEMPHVFEVQFVSCCPRVPLERGVRHLVTSVITNVLRLSGISKAVKKRCYFYDCYTY